jgi:hypothetical protein
MKAIRTMGQKEFTDFLEDFLDALDSGQLKIRVCDYTSINGQGDPSGLVSRRIVTQGIDECFDAKKNGFARSNSEASDIMTKKFISRDFEKFTFTVVIDEKEENA